MKKVLYLLYITFIICGCSNKNIDINNIQAITYNDINLLEEEFEKIQQELNKLSFSKTKSNQENFKFLKITSADKIFNFKVIDKNIYYQDNNTSYIAHNSENLNKYLQEIEKIYTDFSFFSISYEKCNLDEKQTFIKLDNTNTCLIINSNKNLYDFKIHSLELIDNNFNEVNLLYKKDRIKNNVLIKSVISSTPKIKITFSTKYNFIISIVPIYDKKTKSLQLNTSYKQKNRF